MLHTERASEERSLAANTCPDSQELFAGAALSSRLIYCGSNGHVPLIALCLRVRRKRNVLFTASLLIKMLACSRPKAAIALGKLALPNLCNSHETENIEANTAFDIASLVLYGTNAVPIRLKILLDKLLYKLSESDLRQLLHGFGWTPDDYRRGYIQQQLSLGGPSTGPLSL
ncbi:hypothetical protein B4U79_02358 [Dinothrombium tinctorium]|uniref:Uncharacterized protein n=1 Tax=Dinothrombium tinctorium TaxID=1965070 RepID=A0A3S4QWJ2_9ACAR|nr:hypothetical protein B4U79_02358 [Dinothrombium tinctorium]